MAVYVDPLRDWGWHLGPSCHLIADTNEELHEFAMLLGLKRQWFHKSVSGPHYDLTASKRSEAVLRGAIELETRPFVEKLRVWRTAAVARLNAATSAAERARIRADLFR
jgi:hypothetical protein